MCGTDVELCTACTDADIVDAVQNCCLWFPGKNIIHAPPTDAYSRCITLQHMIGNVGICGILGRKQGWNAGLLLALLEEIF